MTARPCAGCGDTIHGEPYQMWTVRNKGPYHETCFHKAHPGETSQSKGSASDPTPTIFYQRYGTDHFEWTIPAPDTDTGWSHLQRAHDCAAAAYRELTGNEPPVGVLRVSWTAQALVLKFAVRAEATG